MLGDAWVSALRCSAMRTHADVCRLSRWAGTRVRPEQRCSRTGRAPAERPRRRWRVRANHRVPYGDYTGYTKLLDGQTLNGWNGESDVWSIDNGAIHANTTKTPGQHHLHYIGAECRHAGLRSEGRVQDLRDRCERRHPVPQPAPDGAAQGFDQNPLGTPMPPGITTFLAAVKAGVAERAPARGNAPAAQPGNPTQGFQNPWQVSGYQFDLDSENRYTGRLYEGQGRGIINLPEGSSSCCPGSCSGWARCTRRRRRR